VSASRAGWVFSARQDLAWFLGPALVSAVVAAVAWRTGALHVDVPPWALLVLVVGCDVAHVWATLYRAYLDPEERRRRGGLLVAVPLACLAAGTLLYAQAGALGFWRVLAYVAAFHFVRQQWGWMAYAGRASGDASTFDRRLDAAAVYAATLYPLLWWHANLPRSFDWFVAGDFVPGLPPSAADAAFVVHVAILGAWIGRQVVVVSRGRPVPLGKALVLATTWLTWYGGIVLLDSDLVFTTSNVLAHGVPYFALVRRYGVARWRGAGGWLGRVFSPAGVALFVGSLLALGYAEESLWDGLVWHQMGALFPLPRVSLSDAALAIVVPALAVPQATHYVLDAFLWRARRDATLSARLGFGDAPASGDGPVVPARREARV
jgi:hypothetical protein